MSDLPYANPFTISTIPALSGAAVDNFNSATNPNSKETCGKSYMRSHNLEISMRV